MRTFTGTTEAAGNAILGAPFWEPGKSVTGTFLKIWDSKVGPCYQFAIKQGQPKIEAFVKDGRIADGDEPGAERTQLDKFSVGALKGWVMALDDLETQGIKLEFRDEVTMTCTGLQKNQDASLDDMILFSITVKR